MFICFLNHMTFFAGCLALHAKRVKSNRHCFTCHQTRSARVLRANRSSRVTVLLCSGKPPRHIGDEDSIFERLPRRYLARVLMKSPTKAIVVVAFTLYVGFTSWGATRVQTGLKLENIVSADSYFARYARTDAAFFIGNGPFIQYVITERGDYTSDDFVTRYTDIVKKTRASNLMDPDYIISWYDHYHNYINRHNLSEHMKKHSDNFVRTLRDNFLPEYPEFANDIVFGYESDDVEYKSPHIRASRFYFAALYCNDSQAEQRLMTTVRAIATNSSLPIIAYSSAFILYEHYASILTDTLLAVIVAIIGMLFIALMFIPHPVSISCVTVSMVTIVLGMLGFLHYWGIELSAVITVQVSN